MKNGRFWDPKKKKKNKRVLNKKRHGIVKGNSCQTRRTEKLSISVTRSNLIEGYPTDKHVRPNSI